MATSTVGPEKRLPALPRSRVNPPDLITLTNQSRNHLRACIRHIWSENDQNLFGGGAGEAWCEAIESALIELGVCIRRGRWLAGLKQRRKTRWAEKEEANKLTKSSAVKGQEETVKGKPKGKGALGAEGSSEQKRAPERTGLFNEHSSPQRREADISLALEQMRHLVTRPVVPSPEPSPKHLLLTVAPFGSQIPLPVEDSGFHLVSTGISCTFSSGLYSLSDSHDVGESLVLYGLEEWDVNASTSDEEPLRIVGGKFTFKGLTSPLQHSVLCKALRVSIFIYLSIILEQHLLSDSNVELEFPSTPTPSHTSLPQVIDNGKPELSPERHTHRHGFTGTGILRYLSKKTSHVLHRHNPMSSFMSRSDSLDLTSSRTSTDAGLHTSRVTSQDGFGRIRRFSLTRGRFTASEVKEKPLLTASIERIERTKTLLSSSPGLVLTPPSLLAVLAKKERRDPAVKLTPDEQVGLTTLLGWDKKSQGKGMVGTTGFVKQQQISFLYSEYTLTAGRPSAGPRHSSALSMKSSQSSSLISSNECNVPAYTPCNRPRWITLRYYSRQRCADKTLGDVISELCDHADHPCDMPGCQSRRGQHELRLIHEGVRITIKLSSSEENGSGGMGGSMTSDEDSLHVWLRCKECNQHTEKKVMNNGSFLFSFGKFVELLIYSRAICTLTPTLCEHTTPPNAPALPDSRFNIIRQFSFHSRIVSITVSRIHDIFEIRVPKLQLVKSVEQDTGKSGESGGGKSQFSTQDAVDGSAEDRNVLRREIKQYWEGVADHLDKLEDTLTGTQPNAYRKALPRLPSVDDAYEPLRESHRQSSKKPDISGLPPTPPSMEGSSDRRMVKEMPPLPLEGSPSSSPMVQRALEANDPVVLLYNMRQAFQRTEQNLYMQLSQTRHSSLNDVRWAFASSAKGTRKRLAAWRRKHLPQATKGRPRVNSLRVLEPEWWSRGCHAVPKGNVIVREDDWGSIIAFTIGSPDYQNELSNMSAPRGSATYPQVPLPANTLANVSSFFSNRVFTSSSLAHDPDLEQDAIWNEPEEYFTVISREEHPRDSTSILSLRDVLRQKLPGEAPYGQSFLGGSSTTSQTARSSHAPPSADSTRRGGEPSDDRPDATLTPSASVLNEMANGDKAPSVISVSSCATLTSVEGGGAAPLKQHELESHTVPEKAEAETPASIPSAFTNTLTSGLGNAMRYMLSTGDHLRPHSLLRGQNSSSRPDGSTIGDRPHVKYEWVVGKRVKFTCIVYYAKQFDLLRRRCGIDEVFHRSLSRSANWAAEGGKSKSNFWKTSDDRFIIKTLVNAWNVADLHVLIDMGPSYFQYMDSTADKPSVLAKLLGFYTVEVKNLESGTVQAKANLLVMENLFSNQKVTKTFDLKGIQGRKAKTGGTGPAPGPGKTMFDMDWIEGQQRMPILLRPHSKLVLKEAIKNDSEFLSNNNIMDYSLLLGVDEERKEIACGLVDTIGSYTFAKTLEHKAKQGLNAGKEVTVVPPAEYRERFTAAMDNYFLACPDKWSKPLDDLQSTGDPSELASVL